MQVLYQHHREPSVHSHLLYQHEKSPCNHDNYNRVSSSDGGDFQHQRQHRKLSNFSHHPGHSCGTTSYGYGTSGSLVTTPSPSPMNRENIYHHPESPSNNSLSLLEPGVHHRGMIPTRVSYHSNNHYHTNFVDHQQQHHHHHHHGTSGNSSNSSLINHGSSPTVQHRHVVNINSSLSTTPLISHHHRSSSGSLTGNSTTNHHHVSSGISCESSSSNANTRTHSRLDHIHDRSSLY